MLLFLGHVTDYEVLMMLLLALTILILGIWLFIEVIRWLRRH